jgi:hypothetical protein
MFTPVKGLARLRIGSDFDSGFITSQASVIEKLYWNLLE